MARLSRIKFRHAEDGYYHVVSRIVLQEYLMGKAEKEYFLKLLKKLSQVYFVRIATFALMSNHVHLILQMIPSEKVSDDDLQRRFDLYYNDDVPKERQKMLFEIEHEGYRERFGDLSRFMQDLKQRFSRWYNRNHDCYGHVWAERFKSVLLEGSRALLACMVYVELNAVRAGIVTKPEAYRYCGLHHYVAGGRVAKWLDHGMLGSSMPEHTSHAGAGIKDQVKRYLTIIYHEGMEERPGKSSVPKEVAARSLGSEFADMGILSFKRRIRYFSDGVFVGSKTFCEEKYHEFRSYFQTDKPRTGKLINRMQDVQRRDNLRLNRRVVLRLS